MDHTLEKDIALIKEFVRHSAEFIAYFELSDTKMQEWKVALDQQITEQRAHYQQQIQQIQLQLHTFEEILTQAGLARFRLLAEELIARSTEHLQEVRKVAADILQQAQNAEHAMQETMNQTTQRLDHYCHDAISKIDRQLAQHDPEHFRRVASDSCDMVERAALDAVSKSKRMLRSIHWKTVALTFLTSIVTAFTIGLYVSDEWPWELHQQAMNERDAGKLLIQAWPQLSHEDRKKILQNERNTLG